MASRPLRHLTLTGTPGAGKSSVAARLGASIPTAELGDLAVSLGAGRRVRGGVEVDLGRLARRARARPPARWPRVVVGHLAHLLPIRATVVLRCHPVELGRRLGRARRGTVADRRANVEAEATDVVLFEALQLGRTVYEVDTTQRTASDVAREVLEILDGKRRPSHGHIAWLEDPSVTDYLLRPHR